MVILICISLMTNDVEQLFICLLAVAQVLFIRWPLLGTYFRVKCLKDECIGFPKRVKSFFFLILQVHGFHHVS